MTSEKVMYNVESKATLIFKPKKIVILQRFFLTLKGVDSKSPLL